MSFKQILLLILFALFVVWLWAGTIAIDSKLLGAVNEGAIHYKSGVAGVVLVFFISLVLIRGVHSAVSQWGAEDEADLAEGKRQIEKNDRLSFVLLFVLVLMAIIAISLPPVK